jgi:2-polyprenyl-6-methoxyphenol hydroxylase-like FAD-dependent oxidoreductase
VYDVIVVGARIAGTATATLLARNGWRVLLVDQAPLPSPTVSTHFFGATVHAHLDHLGVLDTILATGVPRLTRWHLDVEGATYGAPMVYRSAYPYTLCVRRDTLDAVLLERARSEPTLEIRTRARVRSLLRDGDRVIGVVGDGWSEKAAVVVGADGRNSPVAALAGAGITYDGGVLRSTLHAYWDDVVELPEPAMEVWRYGDQILQVGPCDNGWVIMVSLPAERTAEIRAAGERAYLDRLQAIDAMRVRLRRASRTSPVYRCGALRNIARTAAGPGWRLVGDAACHKDPLLGAGITDAVTGARSLVGTLHAALAGESSWEQAEEEYREAADARGAQRIGPELAALPVEPAAAGQLAWIRGVFAHPGFGAELAQHCAELLGGLSPERRKYWQRVADHTADVLGLPTPARIDA